MSPVQKQALKDLLHLMVDKEQGPILQELAGKLPDQYKAVAQALLAAAEPVAEKIEDGVVDKL